jgi:hypothetical protein
MLTIPEQQIPLTLLAKQVKETMSQLRWLTRKITVKRYKAGGEFDYYVHLPKIASTKVGNVIMVSREEVLRAVKEGLIHPC